METNAIMQTGTKGMIARILKTMDSLVSKVQEGRKGISRAFNYIVNEEMPEIKTLYPEQEERLT